MRTAHVIAAAFMAILLAPVAFGADSPPGEKLLRAACTQCHGLDMLAKTRNGIGGWRQTVDKMVNWGAQLRSVEERDALVAFLTSTYGPGSEPIPSRGLPPGAALASSDSAALPSGPGADQVRAYCTMCHDLGVVVATRRTASEWNRTTLAMMAKTGAPVSPADARTIARYLEQHFGLPSSPKD